MSPIEPKPFRRALVADDGRAGGDAAISVAPFIHETLAYSMTVVHAVDVPKPEDVAGRPEEILDYRTTLARKAEEWLDGRIVARFGNKAEEIDRLVELGRPARIVRRAAEDLHADLIVVGPHHKEHILDFGGTQRAVFSGTGCHIWSQPAAFTGLHRVVAPCDLSTRSFRSVNVARDLARRMDLPLLVLHASPPPAFADVGVMYGDVPTPTYVIDSLHEAARSRFDAAMDELDFSGVPSVEREFVISDPVHAIEDTRVSTDLVVMGTRGHTGISAAIFGGVTYSVLKNGASAVFAVE